MWSDYLFSHRRSITLSLALLICVSSIGAVNLTFTPDTRVFFDEADKRLKRLEAFEREFIPSHTILFAINTSNPFYKSDDAITALRWLHETAWGIESAIRVDSLVNLSFPIAENDSTRIAPLLEIICPSECSEKHLETLENPIVARRFVSLDHRVLAVVATFSMERDESQKIHTVSARVTEIEQEFREKFPDVDLYSTGGILMSQAFVDAGQKDSTLTFAITAVVIFVLLLVLLGSLKNTLVILLNAFLAVAVSMGIGGWIGIELNSASAAVPIIVFTLVVATSMHIFSHYIRLRDDPNGPQFALSNSINVNVAPILLTTATSAASLVSLVFVNSPPVRDIGILAAIGVTTGGLLSLTGVPLLLSSDRPPANSIVHEFLQRSLNRFSNSLENTKTFPIACSIVLVVGTLGLTKLVIDDNFVEYFGESTSFREATEFSAEHLAGPNHIEVVVTAENGLFDSGSLTEIERLTSQIRAQSTVATTLSLADIQRQVIEAFGLPSNLGRYDTEAHEQFFLSYEMSLSEGESSSDLINFERTKTHIPVFMKAGSSTEIQELEQTIISMAEDFTSISLEVTGENIPVAHLSSSNIPEVVQNIWISLFITALLITAYFKNWRIGLNALLAITVPIVCGFGIWGYLYGSIGLAGSVVIALAIGVVIDDAIHLIYQQTRANRQGQATWESTRTSIYRVGVPILATTIVFVVGLSPLLTSDFALNKTIAGCTGLILVCSLLFDLIVLPCLLTWSAPKAKTE